MTLNVLFIGGTGEISRPCAAAAVAAGHRVSAVNRGNGRVNGVSQITADLASDADYGAATAGEWDVVCQFMAFTPAQVERDMALFSGRCGQYLFISSASAYEKPVRVCPITEHVPLNNPYWAYSRDKIACEALLAAGALPYTIVRPSHTIRRRFPTAMDEGDAALARMLAGRPVILPDGGRTCWTLTRAEDFALPFVRLFGNRAALGQAVHITSDHAWPWHEVYRSIARGLGVHLELVERSVPDIVAAHPPFEGSLLGDKAYDVRFDNSRIKELVGDFGCESDLDRLLAGPLAAFAAAGGAAALRPDPEMARAFERLAS